MPGYITQVPGVTDDNILGFFEAAAAFVEAEPWLLLKHTRQRQFGLQIPNPIPGLTRVPRGLTLFACVEVAGLTSEAGRSLNGRRGELVPPKPAGAGERWAVRLFTDGRRVKVKPENLRQVDDPDELVVKVGGADGGAYGVQMYSSWAALWAHHNSRSGDPPLEGQFSLTVEFEDPKDVWPMISDDAAAQRRLGAPVARHRATGALAFPLLCAQTAAAPRPVSSPVEVAWARIALLAASQFVHQLSQRPWPPGHHCPTSFEPLRSEFTLDHLGRAAQVFCTFPSGNLNPKHYLWKSFPGAARELAPRPGTVRTVAQAVEFHRKWLADKASAAGGGPASRAVLGHRFGLANALWESEEPAAVVEAIGIAQGLLDALAGEPEDAWGFSHGFQSQVRHFCLDVQLEVGQWEEAARLLSAHPKDMSEVWLWCTALVLLKARGPASSSAKKALGLAARGNPHVAPYLTGVKLMDPEDRHGPHHMRMGGQGFAGGVPNAAQYVGNYGHFWDPASLAWVRQHTGLGTTPSTLGTTPGVGILPEDVTGLQAGRVLCAQCSAFGCPNRCSRCKQVWYCSRECQKAHWKVHKPDCRACPAAPP